MLIITAVGTLIGLAILAVGLVLWLGWQTIVAAFDLVVKGGVYLGIVIALAVLAYAVHVGAIPSYSEFMSSLF